MRSSVIMRYIGMVILINAFFMFVSAGVSLLSSGDTSFYYLFLSGVLTSVLGAFPVIFVPRSENISMKEGYAIVVGAWIVACIVGTFPYLLWGGEFDVANAWFESVSGYTATGATVLKNVELLPNGLLFWRSSTNWLGGIGVVVFALIALPSIGKTKMMLYSVEISPLAKENYRYRVQKIVRILLLLYVGMTFSETLLLKFAGMTWFDAVNHSFSTVATGGFSTRVSSIGYYDSVWIEIIVMFFMVVSGIHYGLVFATITGKRNNIFRSEVVRFYAATFTSAGILISLNLWLGGDYNTFWESLRYGFFNSVSMITTTGFSIADTSVWPSFSVVLLIYLMFQCSCAGSTSGGIKSDRVLLAFKAFRTRIIQQQHPSAIIRTKLNKTVIDDAVINYAVLFIVFYLFIILAGTILVTATGLDIMTGFTMVAAFTGNVGAGFGSAGPGGDYSLMTPYIKSLGTLFMLLGRLEIFGFIQLFLLKWWK